MLSAVPLHNEMERPFCALSSYRHSGSPSTNARRVYTFRHECGSPSFRRVTGHTYYAACTVNVLRQYAPSTIHAFELRGIRFFGTGRVKKQDEGDEWGTHDDEKDKPEKNNDRDATYFVLMSREDSAPHPTLGEMFACDAGFLRRAQASLDKPVPNKNSPFC